MDRYTAVAVLYGAGQAASVALGQQGGSVRAVMAGLVRFIVGCFLAPNKAVLALSSVAPAAIVHRVLKQPYL